VVRVCRSRGGPLRAGEGDADAALDRDEVRVLVDHLFVRTGIDFRRYAQRSLRRRLHHLMMQDGIATVAELRARAAGDAAARQLAERLCVKVTTMFRDPGAWAALRDAVIPSLRSLPALRVWHAGCATGEEAYSLAILLREEGLLRRARIYATDVAEGALDRARAASYPLEAIPEFTRNYLRAGGAGAFSAYYTASAEGAVLSDGLRRAIVFSRHNLATDASFNEFHLVLCRNVLIYFEESLQEHAHELLWRSLAPAGVLALGQREIVPPHLDRGRYERLDPEQKLYRRIR
jgi:chemotaxis protein methyltransferase CheR